MTLPQLLTLYTVEWEHNCAWWTGQHVEGSGRDVF